ncbi:hypothetical protein [Pseudofrankia saprophytica]|uniref:hypothetical protein n=1 Tax=Pseudofrankia saprophytica TaxID=298655 RepID=UPI000234B1B4|nr:hypothetical protein [Pseudofrankia saprophytica]
MANSVSRRKRDPHTPEDVLITEEARQPEDDPTLGISVAPPAAGEPEPKHRIVAIGDSLTHGFQSGAVFNTALSYSAVIAHELGWSGHFRYPTYDGYGGIPFNIELFARKAAEKFGRQVDWFEAPLAAFWARQFADEVEDYWERGAGARTPGATGINHALGVYGWDLRDALERTPKICAAGIGAPKDNLLDQLVEDNGNRAALRVLSPSRPDSTLFDLAQELGDDGGIETLIVFLGANNALPAVVQLCVAWSDDGFDDLERNRDFTVWRPTHFARELDLVAEAVSKIKARHVIWCTVPHVTIAPIARGVDKKAEPGSRYFPYYTRPWITDQEFDPRKDPNITGQQARAIDSAIDQYNDAIVTKVREARRRKLNWYVFEAAGVLDRLASRRYIDDPRSRPAWWTPYSLPPELAALDPTPDSTFLTSDGEKRSGGGLFSLDGVHPTTVGYGILAQELINLMRHHAGVVFRYPDGRPRPDPVTVDFARLIRRDTLIKRPPGNIQAGLDLLGWADQTTYLLRRAIFSRNACRDFLRL